MIYFVDMKIRHDLAIDKTFVKFVFKRNVGVAQVIRVTFSLILCDLRCDKARVKNNGYTERTNKFP